MSLRAVLLNCTLKQHPIPAEGNPVRAGAMAAMADMPPGQEKRMAPAMSEAAR